MKPDVGPVVGGTRLMITGVNLMDVTGVTIGGTELADRTVVSTTQITGTTPAGAGFGPADVVVTSRTYGTATCGGCFNYEPLAIVARPIAAGPYHTCALSRSGGAYCWGEGRSGQLGDGTSTSSPTPVAVAGGLTFRNLAAGGWTTTTFGHTCGLTSDGAAYCWGGDGNLGNASTWTSATPVAVSGGLSLSVLVAYYHQTCGLTSAGTVYCWGDPEGDNSYSQTPYAVAGGFAFSDLTVGGVHDCALTPDGAAYCWGHNESGQLGVGDTTAHRVPVRVMTGLRWAPIAAAGEHTCGLATSGEAFCWGSNRHRQLGIGATTGPEKCHSAGGGLISPSDWPCSTIPVPVATTLRWSSIVGGAGRTCGVTLGAEAYCWGLNSDGQLGDGSNTNSSIPVGVAGGLSFRALAAGYAHTCGITISDVVYCWGANGSGQLGDGTISNSSVPVKVLGQP